MSTSVEAMRWQAPALDRPAPALPKPPSIEELQAIEETARAAGFDAGHTEGFAAGQGDVRRLVAQFEGIVDSLARPLGKLDDEVINALGQLAVRMAGELVGRAYQADPSLVEALARSALDAVGSGQREVELRMHPDDLKTLANLLPKSDGVRLIADPQLTRGDVRVHAESVRIDGRLESRLRAAFEALSLRGDSK